MVRKIDEEDVHRAFLFLEYQTYSENQRSICSRESKYPVGNWAAPSGAGLAFGADPGDADGVRL